jgi:hypothetical protein
MLVVGTSWAATNNGVIVQICGCRGSVDNTLTNVLVTDNTVKLNIEPI